VRPFNKFFIHSLSKADFYEIERNIKMFSFFNYLAEMPKHKQYLELLRHLSVSFFYGPSCPDGVLPPADVLAMNLDLYKSTIEAFLSPMELVSASFDGLKAEYKQYWANRTLRGVAQLMTSMGKSLGESYDRVTQFNELLGYASEEMRAEQHPWSTVYLTAPQATGICESLFVLAKGARDLATLCREYADIAKDFPDRIKSFSETAGEADEQCGKFNNDAASMLLTSMDKLKRDAHKIDDPEAKLEHLCKVLNFLEKCEKDYLSNVQAGKEDPQIRARIKMEKYDILDKSVAMLQNGDGKGVSPENAERIIKAHGLGSLNALEVRRDEALTELEKEFEPSGAFYEEAMMGVPIPS
jgi:hypothetical protein